MNCKNVLAQLPVLMIIELAGLSSVWPQTPNGDGAKVQLRLLTTSRLYNAPVNAVKLSSDKKWLLTGAGRFPGNVECVARLYSVPSGDLLRVFAGHELPVTTVALSKDKRWVLTGSMDGTVRLWDADTGKEAHMFQPQRGAIDFADISDDGKWMVTVAADGTVAVWDLSTFKLNRKYQENADSTASILAGRQGKWLGASYSENAVRLWNVKTGKLIRSIDLGAWECSGMAISSSPTFIAVAGIGFVKVFETDSGKEVAMIRADKKCVSGHVALSRNGQLLATKGRDGTARVWSIPQGVEIRRFWQHGSGVCSIEFSEDAEWLITGAGDNTARIWEIATGRLLGAYPSTATTAPVGQIAFSSDGKYIISTGADRNLMRTASLWEVSSGRQTRVFRGEMWSIGKVAISADSKILAATVGDNTARIVSVKTGKEIAKCEGHFDEINSIALSSSSKMLASGSGNMFRNTDNTVRVWHTTSGEQLKQFEQHTAPVRFVGFSADETLLVSCGNDRTLRLWDLRTGKQLRVFESDQILECAAITGEKTVVFGGGSSGHVQLWDITTGKAKCCFEGHVGAVRTMSLSQDGKWLVTGGADQTARLWNVSTGKQRCVFSGHFDELSSVSISPDSTRVLTSSFDHTSRLWDLATGRELCCLISFVDDSWCVFDANNRYDAANVGDIEGLRWVTGKKTWPSRYFREQFYEPGLLSKYLKANKRP